MRTFQVTWQIDIDAIDERDAARLAWEIQRDSDPANLATVFDVQEYVENESDIRPPIRVDLATIARSAPRTA